MATAAQVAEYRQANQALVALAQRDLQDFWAVLNLENPDTARDIVLEFFPELVGTYGATSSVLGADWYDLLRDVPSSAATFRAAVARPVPTEQAESSARWAMGSLFVGEPDTALSKLLGVAQRLVMQPGRDTIWDSAAMDPVRTGVARVPTGVTTCKFCVMLASRGAIYQSQVSAELVVGRGSNRTGYDANGRRLTGGIGGGIKARGPREIGKSFHDNCDCTSVTIRDEGEYPAGYDPDFYLDLYEQGSGVGRDEPKE